MSILDQLSSQIGERTEEGNRKVVNKCLENPILLEKIVDALESSKDERLLGDCTEVLTKVAEKDPKLIKQYGEILIHLLDHETTRVRWESMHALSLIIELRVDLIEKLFPRLKRILLVDTSTIVRDYTIDMLNNYAKTSSKAAQQAFEILVLVLEEWKDKHAARIFKGFKNCITVDSKLKEQAFALVKPYENSHKPTVKKRSKVVS